MITRVWVVSRSQNTTCPSSDDTVLPAHSRAMCVLNERENSEVTFHMLCHALSKRDRQTEKRVTVDVCVHEKEACPDSVR